MKIDNAKCDVDRRSTAVWYGDWTLTTCKQVGCRRCVA